jgi:M3 family oligoendopeptidase
MITFSQMQYQRPDFDKLFEQMKGLLSDMEQAATKEGLFTAMESLDRLSSSLGTQRTICHIRHTINTNDPFYEAENDIFDQALPRFGEISTEAARIVLHSPFRQAVTDKYGEHLLEKYEVQLKVFKPEIVEDLQEENRLESEYQKLMASAQIEFEGEIRNLSGLVPFAQSTDRDMRRRATSAAWDWIAAQGEQLDLLYDKLVKVRDRIGRKLGYDSFIPVAYARMGRTDWDQEDARRYRQQIVESVVPLVSKFKEEQARRIGIPQMKHYDSPLMFLSGNPTPKGDEAYMVEQASRMYKELSPETDAFFQVMVSQQLMDLTTKPGKANGGYMTFIDDYKVPFIFSNFNGTSGDVDVLTHEAGHAFQGWLQRDVELRDIAEYTSEVAEIHSMSMEFFTHPWMEHFFKEDTEKYYYAHVVDALSFLPYGASIDELQEWVYLHPDATPEERRQQYRRIEQLYMPHIDYDGNAFLENGGRWQKQLHVYLYPFYYLDYTLSQVCALQYFTWDMRDHQAAWQSYMTLCRLSGRVPFKKLVPQSGLMSPFEDGTIAQITPALEKYLEGLDKSKIK